MFQQIKNLVHKLCNRRQMQFVFWLVGGAEISHISQTLGSWFIGSSVTVIGSESLGSSFCSVGELASL